MSTIDLGQFELADQPHTADLIRYLRAMNTLPQVQHGNQVTLAELRLRPGQAALDIGCGYDADVFEMARSAPTLAPSPMPSPAPAESAPHDITNVGATTATHYIIELLGPSAAAAQSWCTTRSRPGPGPGPGQHQAQQPPAPANTPVTATMRSRKDP